MSNFNPATGVTDSIGTTLPAVSGTSAPTGPAGRAETITKIETVLVTVEQQFITLYNNFQTLSATVTNLANQIVALGGAPSSKPVNTALPTLSSSAPVVGTAETVTNGTWTFSPTGYTYSWAAGGVPISGATSSTYVAASGDVGKTLTATVTATNGAGNTSATTAPTTAVGALGTDFLDESFTGTNGAAWSSSNWVTTAVTSPATVTIQSNSGQLVTGTAAYASDANVRTVITKQDVSAAVTMTPTTGEQYGVIAIRCDGTWSGSVPGTAYVIEVDFANGLYKFEKIVGGTATVFATPGGLGASTAVKARIQALGSTITARVWAAGATEPTTWDATVTDTSITAAGSVALTAQNGSAGGAKTITFDNFAMQPTISSGGAPPVGPPPTSTSGFITRSGSNLLLPSGTRWRYVGFGGFMWMGCGNSKNSVAQSDTLFQQLRPASCFRLHNVRSALNYSGSQFVDSNNAVTKDVDNMVQSAKRNGQYIICVLLDYNGECSAPDGALNNNAGFLDSGSHAAWKTWVGHFVSYYAAEPTVAMYEIINEPRGSAIGDSRLEAFYTEMSAYIKGLCPQLVETGMYGSYYSGTPDSSADGVTVFQTVNAMSNVDVANVHDYNGVKDPIVNAVQDASNTSGKPMIVGEWNCSTEGFPNAPCTGNFWQSNPTTSTPGVKAILDTFSSVSVLAGVNVWAWDASVIGTAYEQSVIFASHQI